ncbi:TPA: hypothetical protein HA278_07455 [Candidatus Woesearchaeota archaeon]|nr:hypothetical protein [Candidatus Woesearchaeota archaeon]
MNVKYATHSLEDRLAPLFDMYGGVPPREFMHRHPYFAELLREADTQGGYESVTSSFEFDEVSINVPSVIQLLKAGQISLDNAKGIPKILMDCAGSGKTLTALLALPLFEEHYAKGKKVVATYVSPGNLVPTMMQELRRFMPGYKGIPITQQSREKDIMEATKEDINFVFLGYELSYRNSHLYDDHVDGKKLGEILIGLSDGARDYVEHLAEEGLFSAKDGYKALDRHNMIDLGGWIYKQYQKRCMTNVIDALIDNVLTQDVFSYLIIGEGHNLVHMDSLTRTALEKLKQRADALLIETATAVRNNVHQMGTMMTLVDFVDSPHSWKRIIKNNPRRAKAALDLYAVTPVVSRIQQVDPLVPEEKDLDVTYTERPELQAIYLSLVNSRLFEGRERIELARYLVADPTKFTDTHFWKDTSFHTRVRTFIEQNQTNFDILQKQEDGQYVNEHGRLHALRSLITQSKEEGSKVLAVTERDIAKDLAQRVATDQLVVRYIDSSVNICTKQDGYSDRQIAIMEASVNPDVHAVVATSGTIREGIDGRAFIRQVRYDEISVPFKEVQVRGRGPRRGQRQQVTVTHLHSPDLGINTAVRNFVNTKMKDANAVYDAKPTPEELARYVRDAGLAASEQLAHIVHLNSRGTLSMMFNSLVGAGSKRFAQVMQRGNNAVLLSSNFNYDWNNTHSANCARLSAGIVRKLEETYGKFKHIVSGASGPGSLGRILQRPTTMIELLATQLEFAEDAMRRQGIEGSEMYLGSIHNLQELIALDDLRPGMDVFDKEMIASAARTHSIPDGSVDYFELANAFYFLSPEERVMFLREVHRVQPEGGFLSIQIPRSKIERSSEKAFLEDFAKVGYEVNLELSGEYGANSAHNIDEGVDVSPGSFDPYVIVACQVADVTESRVSASFSLNPGYVIRNGTPTKKDFTHAKEESKRPRIIYDGFFRRIPPIGFTVQEGPFDLQDHYDKNFRENEEVTRRIRELMEHKGWYQ